MSGKIIGGGIVAIALIFGALVYYLQEYYYYAPVAASAEEIVLTRIDGGTEPIPAENIEAIDASSSPIRYRACFATPLSLAALAESYAPYDAAVPLNAPHWFDCFDARAVGEALERGEARAFLGRKDVATGVDRVVAIFGDGRGFVWNQLNGELSK